MENTNNKIVTISLMFTGILVGLVVFVLLDSLAALATGSLGAVVGKEIVRHGLPVAVGISTFFVLQFNKKVVAWAEEVVIELRKIVWPSRKDTMTMTMVVCVMLLISGLVLGFMDVLSASVIDWLLHHNFMGLFS
jgi:preprotein translocase subunit SecE